MKGQLALRTSLHRLGGYYLIPHELLHVLAYRLLGKPYHYEWGGHQVTSTAQLSRGERLVVLLLPVMIFLTLSFFFHFMWIVLALSAQMSLADYILEAPRWHFLFHILANLCMFYCGTAYRDVRRALALLFGQEKTKQNSHNSQQQTIQK